MSNFADAYRVAKAKGYTCDGQGNVYGPKGNKLKPCKKGAYLGFKIWYNKKTLPLHIHRFHAYLIYGEDALKPGISVRHHPVDDKHCNRKDNLLLGNQRQNYYDNSEEKRLTMAGYVWAVRRTPAEEFEQILAIGW